MDDLLLPALWDVANRLYWLLPPTSTTSWRPCDHDILSDLEEVELIAGGLTSVWPDDRSWRQFTTTEMV